MEDCIIIGGGPAGLSAAINLRQRGHGCLVVYAQDGALQKAQLVDNCAGLPGVSGPALLATLREHALQKGAVLRRGRVDAVLPMGDSFGVSVGGDMLTARSLILACGAVRGGSIPGEETLLGQGVSYCATCDGMLYRGRSCVVWGLAPEAVADAAYLFGIGVQVTYVAAVRPKELDEHIPFITGALQTVEGQDTVQAVQLTDGQRIFCDGVFILREAIAPARLIEGLAVQNGVIAVDRSMATNLPGVFAAGDCTGAPLQVNKALGEGQTAGLAAAAFLQAQRQN